MTGFELYVFFLCLTVFILLTGVFTFFIVTLIKLNIKLVESGSEDELIIKERQNPPKKSGLAWIETAVSLVLCILFVLSFAFSIYVRFQEEKYYDGIPTINVVASSSMETKHKSNTYLVEYDLNDQFSTFDLIITYKVPPAEELQTFDIVVYEAEGMMIIHRIIDIEPPNSAHPDEYWFTCKGDALENTDRFPVRYSQIKGIYRGERVPFVGSFVAFMQSPAGLLCILLILFGFIAAPIAEKTFEKAKAKRYEIIGKREE